MRALTIALPRVGSEAPRREVVEIPVPEASRGEVVVRIHFAGLNYIDREISNGDHNRSVARILKRSPVASGIEMAGIAETAGAGIEKGDRVVGYTDIWRGPFYHSQCVATPARNLTVVPPAVSLESAASIVGGALTSITALERKARLRCGQQVLITGASGSVGVTAVQLAAHIGAEVTAVCHSSQLDFVKAQGASMAFAYDRSEMPVPDGQFDVVFDTAPSLSFATARPFLTARGHYITTMPHQDIRGFATSLFSFKKWVFLLERNTDAARMGRLRELISAGAFTEVIDTVYHLDDAADAFERQLESGKQGKILLDMRDR